MAVPVCMFSPNLPRLEGRLTWEGPLTRPGGLLTKEEHVLWDTDGKPNPGALLRLP